MRTLLLATLLALAAGCTSDADDASADNATEDDGTMPPTARALTASLFDRTPGVNVPPTTMGIDPSTLELTLNERVNLTVVKDGTTGHDLVIEGLDVATQTLEPGAAASVEFTPTEAGTYRMYCSIGGDGPLGHAAQGMQGEVVVS